MNCYTITHNHFLNGKWAFPIAYNNSEMYNLVFFRQLNMNASSQCHNIDLNKVEKIRTI